MRFEPIGKRIRAVIRGGAVVDSTRVVLVWEPRRVVPSYAVPADDIRGELAPAGEVAGDAGERGGQMPGLSSPPVLYPSVPFAAHTARGQVVDVRANGQDRPGAGFVLEDPVLAGYVVLDFRAFDGWYEEEEPNVGHPRDPFHRIDVLASSRRVRLELDGHVLAESSRPMLLFETTLPVRYDPSREDIHAELRPSETRTYCAYKGQASYWSATVGGRVCLRHRVDLPGATARRRASPRSYGVLRRADQRGRGWRTPGTSCHALVTWAPAAGRCGPGR